MLGFYLSNIHARVYVHAHVTVLGCKNLTFLSHQVKGGHHLEQAQWAATRKIVDNPLSNCLRSIHTSIRLMKVFHFLKGKSNLKRKYNSIFMKSIHAMRARLKQYPLPKNNSTGFSL